MAVTTRVSVAWGDMDAMGHVNNTVYLRWFETARITWLVQTGLLQPGGATGPILARTEIDYRIPVTFPDTVEVSVHAERVGNASVTLAYTIRSAARDNAVVAEGRTVMVMIELATGRSVALSDVQRATIQGMEGPSSPR
jgi:acyl-CoA thioester hydrolase